MAEERGILSGAQPNEQIIGITALSHVNYNNGKNKVKDLQATFA